MKIFITGSTTGLGLIAGQMLQKQGHEVILHARNKSSKMIPDFTYVYGDLSQMTEVKSLADQVNALGPFDSIIHNAGVYEASSQELFNVNVLAPFALSQLIWRPERMVFMSSGMHLGGELNLNENKCSYSDTKLFDMMLAKHFAQKWPTSYVNAVDPGWVPTRMGGASAPDNLEQGAQTQSWLAVSEEKEALVSGRYFHHKSERKYHPLADSEAAINELVSYLTTFFPAQPS